MDEPLGRQLAVTGRIVRERFDAGLGQHGASLAAYVLLRCADDEEGLSQTELAHRLHIEGPTLVRHLDRMETEGLLERCRDAHDRRVMRVCLTPSGRRRHAELREIAASLDARLRALLTPDETDTVERVLARIREHWHPEGGGHGQEED
jgi:MarR family transcriptional regulator, transcriptional regulator for hemolysin